MRKTRTKVLLISSGGGHWVQLLRLRPAFEGYEVSYATVRRSYRVDLPRGARFHVVPDANIWNKPRLLLCALSVLLVILRERPDVVVSTGAAPGYFAVRFARLLRARTLWIDSVANVDQLSLSGREAGRHVDYWITQWPHLAGKNGPFYHGSVL